MAVDNSLESLLSSLTASVEAATQALPEESSLLPPKDGISLLDVKNDLLLSYLQNLVFLILLKLRSHSSADAHAHLQREVTEKLVELRIYLEKGVWPLENKLKYQIDKILRTTETAERKPVQKPAESLPTTKDLNADESGASDAESDVEEDEDLDAESFGPNRAAFVRPKAAAEEKTKESSKDGIYRPPRITPMAMPTTQGREEKAARQHNKSATLDEFVASELSTAPLAMPSIGSTIVAGGRRMKSDKERREEQERREYEEANFTRLPAASKKEKARQSRARDGGWGGEEWRGLGAGLDRIDRLTKKKGGSLGSLERSRKRPVEDGNRGSGVIGEAFEKRRKYRRV
ncbi:hypothetical protein M011DRAFT_468126 [Sporormia fimetaria CBS 119925]|uniref:Uncharacterized protein n=1 Tax=Sporormia fimetaria CBS 119925 TaxID=1340428 RepID=A0A6A6V9R1_9PLEO|nr:hypothetical protein M011DRAFT_468126 [Sporormia fimetaria CBS 119925]